MAEIGIDINHGVPTPVDFDTVSEADVVITLGGADPCPVIRRALRGGDLDDAAAQPILVVRPIRNQIRDRVHALIHELAG
jgi:arsenate reductase